MDITSLHKYIALNKMANGTTEVLFAGQPCLTILEGMMGSIWKINPVFAKLVYGANVFEDIPQCIDGSNSTEEAIAAGLIKLNELGAFKNEIDIPDDTYAATLNKVDEEVKQHSIKTASSITEAHFLHYSIMRSISENTFPREPSLKDRSSYYKNNFESIAKDVVATIDSLVAEEAVDEASKKEKNNEKAEEKKVLKSLKKDKKFVSNYGAHKDDDDKNGENDGDKDDEALA